MTVVIGGILSNTALTLLVLPVLYLLWGQPGMITANEEAAREISEPVP